MAVTPEELKALRLAVLIAQQTLAAANAAFQQAQIQQQIDALNAQG